MNPSGLSSKRTRASVSIALCCCMTVAKAASASDLPALLAHATAGSGWASACPARDETERRMMAGQKLATSPELSDRLARRFPSGSSVLELTQELAREGFKSATPCETDPTIMRSSFFKKGSGLLSYDVSATVYWKTTGDEKIVWTQGFVFYTGL